MNKRKTIEDLCYEALIFNRFFVSSYLKSFNSDDTDNK